MAAAATTVVVGASLAGLRAAEALRSDGDDGTITLVGAEEHLPYDRPPLSKQLLTGKVDADATALPIGDDLDLDWVLGRSATGLDLDAGRVLLDGGEAVPFDRLVIATGSFARPLPGVPAAEGLHLLRTLDDALALRSALGGGRPRVVIVGAGVIGLEVASSARTLGLEVTVLEAAPQPLARLVGPALGPVCAGLHTDHGVDLRLGVSVAAIITSTGRLPVGGAAPAAATPAAGRVVAVELAGGERVEADAILVGVGASPATAWLAGSGVDLDDGVRCDSHLRVLRSGRPLPHVVAAGDVARWDLPGEGPTRLEHWTNAADQGQAAAATLRRGDDAPEYRPVPYVWSDQHGKKLQLLGLPRADDEVVVVDGSLAERRFVAAYGRAGRVVAAFGMSRPARVMALRAAIETGAAFPPA